MTQIELTDEELAEVEQWYNAAAGESATASDRAPTMLKGLLRKFGFEVHTMDEGALNDA